MFKNRSEAGKELAKALKRFENQPQTLVIALPRGGVIIGFEVAKALDLPLDITCPRKIGAPFNPELAIGAITESGEGIFNRELIKDLDVSETYIKQEVEKQRREANERLKRYRQGRGARQLTNQTVILVDDGLATGSTMRAAIQSIRLEKAKKIVMAIPVAPLETLKSFEETADEIVCLATPSPFYAVGQFYDSFEQTEDEEVIKCLSTVTDTQKTRS